MRRKKPHIDYRKSVTVPIRDMYRDGQIMFQVIVYGVEPRDLSIVPGGAAPMIKAVERIGADANRFQAVLWDIPSSDGRSVSGWENQ